MSEPITKPRVSAAAKIVLVLAAAAVLLAVFALAAPGSKFFFPLVSLWCNLALFACVLLVLRAAGIKFDLFHKAVLVGLWAAALVYFFWALGRRSFVYIWDYVNYINKQYWAEAAFLQGPAAGFQYIFGSFAEDYTNFITLFTDSMLARNLAELLRRQGYTVDVSSDGVSGYDNASTDLYDLILLDAMLPGMDGFTLLRKLRTGGHAVPVLMLTARSDLSDRVQGLDCGADYYLTKPFEPEELLACVRSLLRRGGGDARTDDAITFGDLRLEPGTFQLSCGERSLRLSRREYDLLELLLRSQGRVVPKEQLLLKVWGYDSDAEDNNVEVYISFLRRKLTHLHSAVTIRTRRMVGYFLEVEA